MPPFSRECRLAQRRAGRGKIKRYPWLGCCRTSADRIP